MRGRVGRNVRTSRLLARVFGASACLFAVTESASALAVDVTVRPKNLQQTITGFGASSAWTAAEMRSDSDADLLFTRDSGIGLTLLRVRIAPPASPPPGGACSTLEVVTAQQAVARGVTVWATPWSPPPFWKSNDSLDYGGSLLAANADDWANCLAGFVSYMQSQNVPIAFLSAQNEPTVGTVNYDSCVYTPAQLTDFIANHLAPALTRAGLTTPIMAPETQGWGNGQMTSFTAAILANPAATSAVGVFATHSYSGAASPLPLPAGKNLWETEWYDQAPTADPGMVDAITTAMRIQNDLVNGNVSAWMYWWIYPASPDNGGLFDMASRGPAKRLYALGNFSRFVLPGYSRILATTTAPTPGIAASAYVDPAASQIVIVAINSNTTAASQNFVFDSVATGSWTAYVTSATENSVSAGNPVASGADPSALTVSLEAQSVTTLVGSITGPGPMIPMQEVSLNPPATDAGACACSEVKGRGGSRPLPLAAGASLAFAWVARRRRGARRR
jgi:glucuronoarabinoxylan endo-1,4-beta-xylanase